MLRHATLDQLEGLRLHGMAKAFAEQLGMPEVSELSFEERLGLLVDREATERENRRLVTRLRKAKLRQQAGPRRAEASSRPDSTVRGTAQRSARTRRA